MTDHERAFLTAIAAEPDADVHRLIYADWLEEQGRGERAEFVRVQIKLAKTPEPEEFTIGLLGERSEEDRWRATCRCCRELDGELCKHHSLRRRERELLDEHYHRWVRELPADYVRLLTAPIRLDEPPQEKHFPTFRRGFISCITLPTAAFLQHAADIIEAVPMLEEVRLTDKEPWLDDEYDPDWSWFDDVLPRPLYSLMLKLARSTRQLKGIHEIDGHWVSFDTPENARIALSVVCLSFAREQLARRRDPKKYARPRSVTYP